MPIYLPTHLQNYYICKVALIAPPHSQNAPLFNASARELVGMGRGRPPAVRQRDGLSGMAAGPSRPDGERGGQSRPVPCLCGRRRAVEAGLGARPLGSTSPHAERRAFADKAAKTPGGTSSHTRPRRQGESMRRRTRGHATSDGLDVALCWRRPRGWLRGMLPRRSS